MSAKTQQPGWLELMKVKLSVEVIKIKGIRIPQKFRKIFGENLYETPISNLVNAIKLRQYRTIHPQKGRELVSAEKLLYKLVSRQN